VLQRQRFMSKAPLFLSLESGTASRKLSIVCNHSPLRGRISSPKSSVQGLLPNHTEKPGKHRCTHRLLCKHPNPPQRWFHVCPASLAILRVPRLCVRCVRPQPAAWFENQGLSAKTHHHTTTISQILGFLLSLSSKRYF
jgi:hypothetical protein